MMDEIAEHKNGLRVVSGDGSEKARTPKKGFAAIRTGFRRTDERSGRTVEMVLCSRTRDDETLGRLSGPHYVFFLDVESDASGRVFCESCREKHPVVDVVEAIRNGRLTADASTEGSTVILDGVDLVAAVIEAARPKAT